MTAGEIVLALLTSSAFMAVLSKLLDPVVQWITEKYSKKRATEREAEQKRKAEEDKERAELREAITSLREDMDDSRKDTIVLMHDRIYQIFRELRDDESITAEEASNLKYLYERYKARGGNHDAEELYTIIISKPKI